MFSAEAVRGGVGREGGGGAKSTMSFLGAYLQEHKRTKQCASRGTGSGVEGEIGSKNEIFKTVQQHTR